MPLLTLSSAPSLSSPTSLAAPSQSLELDPPLLLLQTLHSIWLDSLPLSIICTPVSSKLVSPAGTSPWVPGHGSRCYCGSKPKGEKGRKIQDGKGSLWESSHLRCGAPGPGGEPAVGGRSYLPGGRRWDSQQAEN